MDSEKMFHQRSSIPLLVVDKNKDHQLLIGYCLRAKIPQVEPTFATTTQDALSFLKRSSNQRENFPKLVLLDLSLPKTIQGFALLEVQFLTKHLGSLGAVEVSASEYIKKLQNGLKLKRSFLDVVIQAQSS